MRTDLCFILICGIVTSSCVQKMGTNGHLDTYGPDPILSPRSLVRHPPTGTIARGELESTQDVQLKRLPSPLSREFVQRGRERFNVYCSPCHDYTGHGNGMIVQRGFLAPPSFHTERLKSVPDRYIYDVISNGFGAMYGYGDRVAVQDRWAVVAYIRALQLSESVALQDLNAQEHQRLQEIKE